MVLSDNDILLPKLYWRRPRICKSFEITSTICSNSERSEQFLVTECFFNSFLRFLRSNRLEQFEFKLEKKILWFRNMQLEKFVIMLCQFHLFFRSHGRSQWSYWSIFDGKKTQRSGMSKFLRKPIFCNFEKKKDFKTRKNYLQF